ncbi:MAG: glycosyltransferase family 1 protein [Calditrichia bacterium]
MNYLGKLKVVPKLPEEISRLSDLAYNLYFSWHPEVRDLFISIDRQLWKTVNHNPVRFLQDVQQQKLIKSANDPHFVEQYKKVLKSFDDYINNKNTWFNKEFPDLSHKIIAYFTAEFGFHESLPIYAGGLGVLAGDHMKSARDLGIPVVGVSLFYNQTYFTQEIDAHGNQIALYKSLTPEELPLQLVVRDDGTPLLIKVPLANRQVSIRIWKAQVGRLSAYLLDTNIPENKPHDREITARLYGGDQEMRISQEIVLGMGGVLALDAMGIQPSAWHMNEGHSVFLALQRILKLVQERGLRFNEALEAVTANTIFTTHTPVPAGNDAFPLHIKDKYFQKYWETVGINRHQFMELGSQVQPEGYEIFNLTILALNLSKHRNGVSRLHGEVSQKLWKTIWPDLPTHEIPISFITNGIHVPTWMARKTRKLCQSFLHKKWEDYLDDKEFWTKIEAIPDEALWKTKLELKEKLINHLRERLEKQYRRSKIGTLQIQRVNQFMRKDVLTIGFARRFATYKRGNLIFKNVDRLRNLVNNSDFPVQFIFAGKAHPKDDGGQDLIRQIFNMSLSPDFRGKIVFVENYDMGFARDLISGVDVWLNNPRRTQEASGTSGQKAGVNGVLNFSVLDGWWAEGYNQNNGWAFGDQEDFESLEALDSWDSEELYDILENDIIPLYYQRDSNNIPTEWIKKMKQSMISIIPQFNTHRMIKEYLYKMYIPAISLGERLKENDYAIARDFASWREKAEKQWFNVAIKKVENSIKNDEIIFLEYGETLKIDTVVQLGNLTPKEVKVQIYMEKSDGSGNHKPEVEIFDMEFVKKLKSGDCLYSANISPSDSGNFTYSVRILPFHPDLPNPVELGLVKWFP